MIYSVTLKRYHKKLLLCKQISYHVLNLYEGDFHKKGYSSGVSLIYFKGYKNKPVNAYFGVGDFYDLSLFTNKILNVNLSVYNVQTVYVKVRYSKDSFLMAGNQFGFKFSSVKDFQVLFNDINTRLEDYFSSYNLEDEDIVYVQVSFRLLDRMIQSDLVRDKENENINYLSSTEIKTTQNTIAIPVTTSEDDLGKCLPVVLDNNNIKEVSVIFKDVKCNFLDIIIF